MPQLKRRFEPEKREAAWSAGEFGFTVAFTNTGAEPLNISQASHPALVLDLRDRNDREVLLPPPSAPDALDLEEGELIEPGGSRSTTSIP